MGEVIDLNVETSVDIPPDKVLADALGADLDEVVVMGWKGDDLYVGFSSSYVPDILYLLMMAQKFVTDIEE